MGTPRDIFKLSQDVRLALPDFNAFAPGAAGTLLSSGLVADLIPQVTRYAQQGPQSVLELCLQTLQVQRDDLAARSVEAEFVATLPTIAVANARPTEQVVREMLQSASEEVVALGYEISNDDIISQFHDCCRRVRQMTLICDREKGSAEILVKNWPSGTKKPLLLRDKERPDAAKYASMHGKALVVDGQELLITSANFTFHGMQGNIEFGVRLKGTVAAEARDVIWQIVQSGLLEPVT